jgi:hypothetical protein
MLNDESTRTAAATSRYLPVLKLRSGRAIISTRSDLDGCGPFEPKGAGEEPMTAIPRRPYIGRPVGKQSTDEAEHYIRWPGCGGPTAAISARRSRIAGNLPRPCPRTIRNDSKARILREAEEDWDRQ